MKLHKNPSSVSLLAFDYVVVLLNPAGTNVQRGQDYISELRELYPDKVTVVETSAKGSEATIAHIRKHSDILGEKTLFCVAAGDGTVSLVVELLASAGERALSAKAQKSSLLPIWGGNANDLAYMLNGFPQRTSLQKVLSEGAVQSIYPLAVTVEHDGTVTQHIAACYVSFGASATIADHLNRPEHRHKPISNILVRIVRELRMAQQIWRHAPTFAYTQDGRRRRAYEIVCANGSRIAKVDRLPARLAEHGFYVDSLEYKSIKWIGRKVLRVLQGKTLDNIAHEPVVFTFRKPLLMQIDGEPTRLDSGAKVMIAVHDKPFYAVASALKEGERPARMRRKRAQRHGLSAFGVIVFILVAFGIFWSMR